MDFPKRKSLNATQLAAFLEIDRHTLLRLVRCGRLPNGVIREGQKRPTWDRNAAAVCLWIHANSDRFPKMSQEEKSGVIP